MWIINELKKDIIASGGFLAGIVVLMYLVRGREDVYFLQYALRVSVAVMSIGGIMLIQSSIGKSVNNIFKFLAITYRYVGIGLIIILMAKNQSTLYASEEYIKIRLGVEFFEIIFVCMAYCYVKREFNQVKVYCITFISFLSIMYGVLSPNFFQYPIYEIKAAAYFAELMMIAAIIGLLHLNYFLLGKLDKRIFFRMYLFLGFKGLYHLADIFYLYTNWQVIGLGIILLRLIYTYHLVICLFDESVLLPWQELLNKVKLTDEKLTNNQKDRHNIINLSHELKTPIHVIQSAADILNLDAAKETDSEFAKQIKEIKMVCYQSTNLIINIIDNNKLTEGYIYPRDSNCSLITLIDNIIIALAEYTTKWSIQFDPQEEEIYVNVDEELIQRSLLNLIELLIRHQKKESNIHILVKLLGEKAYIELTSETTLLPSEYIEGMQEICNKENINELAALEFVKKVLSFYDEKLQFTVDENKGTTISMPVNLSKMSDKEEICFVDYQENVNMLLNKIKLQYADL